MTEYSIHRWDAVMFGNSITKFPMIYVKPDTDFLEFIRDNHYAVMCEIKGTGMIYDGKQIPGVVDKSCFVPNCRPNYFEKTGYYVVTLRGTWNGYPPPNKLGTVVFKGLTGKLTEKEFRNLPTPKAKHMAPMAATSGEGKKDGLTPAQIAGIVAGIVAILILLFFVVKNIKS